MRGLTKILGLLALALAEVAAVPAKAEALMNYRGKLFCEGNRALILLGGLSLESAMASLPPGTEGFANDPVDGNECTLVDGREVRVKIGEHRPAGTGECGTNSDGWASLWVDRRRVLSQHAFFSECWTSSGNVLLLEDDALTACLSIHLAEWEKDGRIGRQSELTEPPYCHSESQRLREARLDLVEYPEVAADPLPFGEVRLTIGPGEDPTFCARFLSMEPPPGPYREEIVEANFLGPIGDPRMFQNEAGNISIEQDYIHAIAEMDDRPEFVRLGQSLDPSRGDAISYLNAYGVAGFGFENVESVDFDNDGTGDIVIHQGDRTHYFWGDRYLVLPMAEGIAAIEALNSYAAAGNRRTEDEVDAEVARIFRGIEDDNPDGDVRYRLQAVFRYQGQTLVFATRFNGYTGAMVYRPRPGGIEEPVCVFERRPENW